MWRYQQPTVEHNKQVDDILTCKEYLPDSYKKYTTIEVVEKLLEVEPNDTHKMLAQKSFWFTMFMRYPSNILPFCSKDDPKDESKDLPNWEVITSRVQHAMIEKYSFPDNKAFVETQWRYVLQMVVGKYDELDRLNLELLFRFRSQVSTRLARYKSLQHTHHFKFADNRDAFKATIDHFRILGMYWFGSYLRGSDHLHSNIFLNGRHPCLNLTDKDYSITLPQFGNIMVGEVSDVSLSGTLEGLKNCGYQFKIDLGTTELTRLQKAIAIQILTRSKVGFLSNTKYTIFITITNVTEKSITVQVDVAMVSNTYIESPQIFSPFIFMIAKIAETHRMNPMDYRIEMDNNFKLANKWAFVAYLDHFFSEDNVKEAFKSCQNQIKDLKYSTIYHDMWRSRALDTRKDPEFHSYVCTVPKNRFDIKVSNDIPGDDVVIRMFDYHFSFSKLHRYSSNHRMYVVSSYKRAIAYTEKVNEFNKKNGCKINTNPVVYTGYCAFWKHNNTQNDCNNYSASGLVIVFRKLTERPKTTDDFLKGLKQLIMMDDADLGNFRIRYDDMFMDNGSFVFCSYGATFTCVSEGTRDPMMPLEYFPIQLEQYVSIWRSKVDVTDDFVDEAVELLRGEMKQEGTDDE